MHNLQAKHIKLKKEEVEILLKEFNMSVVQLPKISKDDVSVSQDCDIGDVLLIERKIGDTIENYYRVVS
jgi:DNA-directed RNA polymerase subunit H (RpoH/RPB5)